MSVTFALETASRPDPDALRVSTAMNSSAETAKPWPETASWLVRSPNPLGDACMSLPAVRALRRAFPAAHIAVACRGNLAPLWQACDAIDAVLPFAKGLSPWAVGRLLRQHGPFAAGLLLPNSVRSALELRLGGVKSLVGYAGHYRRLLLRRAVDEVSADSPRHHLHRYLDLVRALGADPGRLDEILALPPAPAPPPRESGEIHLGLCPGAEYGNAKRYPVERYAEAIALLRRARPGSDIRVSIYGSPAERSIGDELVSLLDEPRANRAGDTDIAGLVAELRTCHLLATNDTGTMHLAAALGVPVVAVFGSTDPDLTSPIGSGHEIVQEKPDCSPCFLRECPVDYRCMLRIEPATVAAAMSAVLDRIEAAPE